MTSNPAATASSAIAHTDTNANTLTPAASPRPAEPKRPLTPFSRVRTSVPVVNRPKPPRPPIYKPSNR